MTSFLNFHAFAATRGDGLRPEFRAFFERVAAAPRSELTVRNDGMIQSGPDPISAEVSISAASWAVRINGTKQQFAEVHEAVMATSPNFYNMSRPVALKPALVVE
jgi:hypothetical protein